MAFLRCKWLDMSQVLILQDLESERHGTRTVADGGIKKIVVACYDWKSFVKHDAKFPRHIQKTEWL